MKTIKDMPEHTRPREKLRERGASALTDEELVAAILGMGTAGVDVRTIAKQVAGLIREHKTGLTLDHLLAVPESGCCRANPLRSLNSPAATCSKIPSSCYGLDVLPLLTDTPERHRSILSAFR